MVNTKHDATSYEKCSYQREIFDGNALYDAKRRAEQGSDWKPQVQSFDMGWLFGLRKLQKEHETCDFEFMPNTEFTMRERGKIRHITGEQIHDRIAKHVVCDEVLSPNIRKYLIYDNGASLKGKGIDFSRRRLLVHLRRYYRSHGSNEGYILLMDYSKYYDNIRHDVLMAQFEKYITDERTLVYLRRVLENERIDVSYLTDEEYARCMDDVFNSLEYEKVDKRLCTGEKFMAKHLNIGDQIAQVAGIIYPIPIDNYVKIVRGMNFYGRYMDDSYIIHEDKDLLRDIRDEILRIGKKIGINLNIHKTRICKLSSYWRFLQIQYSLTETGRVVQKINPKRLTAMRRKLKKLAPRLTEPEFDQLYGAWFKAYYKIMSKIQRENLDQLYKTLKEEYYVHSDSDGRNED